MTPESLLAHARLYKRRMIHDGPVLPWVAASWDWAMWGQFVLPDIEVVDVIVTRLAGAGLVDRVGVGIDLPIPLSVEGFLLTAVSAPSGHQVARQSYRRSADSVSFSAPERVDTALALRHVDLDGAWSRAGALYASAGIAWSAIDAAGVPANQGRAVRRARAIEQMLYSGTILSGVDYDAAALHTGYRRHALN